MWTGQEVIHQPLIRPAGNATERDRVIVIDEHLEVLPRFQMKLLPHSTGQDHLAFEGWFTQLDIYFELRNCIIHRNGRTSGLLNQKTDYYKTRGKTEIEVWPNQLDYFRHQFIDCLLYIEQRIKKRFATTPTA
jgi:hypothetical protein